MRLLHPPPPPWAVFVAQVAAPLPKITALESLCGQGQGGRPERGLVRSFKYTLLRHAACRKVQRASALARPFQLADTPDRRVAERTGDMQSKEGPTTNDRNRCGVAKQHTQYALHEGWAKQAGACVSLVPGCAAHPTAACQLRTCITQPSTSLTLRTYITQP